jgi:hypothetical protein
VLRKYKTAAKYLGWNIRTLHRYAEIIGKSPSRIGRRLFMLFTEEELEQMKEERKKHGRK